MRALTPIVALALVALIAACNENYGQSPDSKTGDISENATASSNPGSAPDAAISPSNTEAPDPLEPAEPSDAAPTTTTP